ncbi:MAG: hypothetical protein R6V04_02960 [bacterium]
MKKCINQIKSEEGFSLIELIMIILILGISLVPLTTIVTTNQKGAANIALAVQVEYFTQSVMEELIANYRSNAGGYDTVINEWTGATIHHPDPEINMTAGVSIVEAVDPDTGIQYAEVVVEVNLENGLSTSLVYYMVDDGT